MEDAEKDNNSGRRKRPALEVGFARSPEDIREAQKLRYRVFADEMGARLPSTVPGVDQDDFDPHCEHLVVRKSEDGEIIGTYRILPPERAAKVGYYSATEFNLERLDALRPGLVELGRSCVHPDFRTGSTISLLWSGLAQYMIDHGYAHLMGCASISMSDGGHAAASIYHRLSEHLSPEEFRVYPLSPLPLEKLQCDQPAEMPPLVKGYIRAGAWICGAPAWDPDFNTADLPILLPMDKIAGRYAKRYVGQEA